jgi:hypothetical protein
MVFSIACLGFFCLGILFTTLYNKIIYKRESSKLLKERNSFFSKVLDKIYSNEVQFKDRINNSVTLTTSIEETGFIDIVYLMDNRQDIAIFRNGKCIYTTDGISEDIVDELITTINIYFKSEINDVISVLGMVFYKPTFESKFGIKLSDLKAMYNFDEEFDNKNKQRSVKSYNIDEILDKISAQGIQSLTLEEKRFLDNYNG